MATRKQPQALQAPLPRIRVRLSTLGLATGFILLLASGLLPERMQIVSAGSGIALALLGAGLEISSSSYAGLRWKGASPALAIVLGGILGALPGILSGVWLRPASPPVAARSAPVRAATKSWSEVPVPVSLQTASLQGAMPPVAASAAPPPHAAALNELSYILEQRARPALDSLHRLLTSVAAAPESTDPLSLKSQLEPSVTSLAEVATSLERIESENSDLTPELRAAIAGGRPLSALNSSLSQLSVSQGDARGYGATRLRRLASATESASRWVDSVDQQLGGVPGAVR